MTHRMRRLHVSAMVTSLAVCAQPTFTFHKDGERVSSFSGADPTKLRSSLEELQD